MAGLYQEAYNKLQQQYSVYGTQGDEFRTSYYDTATLATGVNQYTLFNAAVGLNSVTKAQTNMETASAFPKNTNFFVERIGMRLYSPSSATPISVVITRLVEFLSVCQTTNLVLNMSGKQNIGEWPLVTFLNTANLGLVPVTAGDGTYTTTQSFASTWYSVGSFKNQTAIPLLEQDNFSFTLTQYDTTTSVPAGLNGYRLKIVLDGIIQRRK